MSNSTWKNIKQWRIKFKKKIQLVKGYKNIKNNKDQIWYKTQMKSNNWGWNWRKKSIKKS